MNRVNGGFLRPVIPCQELISDDTTDIATGASVSFTYDVTKFCPERIMPGVPFHQQECFRIQRYRMDLVPTESGHAMRMRRWFITEWETAAYCDEHIRAFGDIDTRCDT